MIGVNLLLHCLSNVVGSGFNSHDFDFDELIIDKMSLSVKSWKWGEAREWDVIVKSRGLVCAKCLSDSFYFFFEKDTEIVCE